MKKYKGILFSVLTLTLAHSPIAAADDICNVVLFGGSSVFTSYLPPDEQHHVVLQEALTKAYPDQKVVVKNWADNGEFIARFLLRGTYEGQRSKSEGMDIAILRFGINDQKRVKPDEYSRQLVKMIELLEADFPGVAVFLETGVYVDFPKHYKTDRNKALGPYWDVAKSLGADRGLTVIDYFEAGRQEALAGNWDIRARRGLVLDSSQDAGKENDPEWFSNIHPNIEGVRIAVKAEVEAIKAKYPEKLPTGNKPMERKAETQAYYSEYLGFSMERLAPKGANPEKELQEPSQKP